MQTSARRVISQEAAKTDDSLYESDSDSEKLTVDLTHQLQITALARQLGLPTTDIDQNNYEMLKALQKDSKFPELFIGTPLKPRVDVMATYVNQLDSLIDFHPEVHSNLLQAPATLDTQELMERLAKTSDLIVARNDFEKQKLALIKEKFGSMERFHIYSKEQKIKRAMQSQEQEAIKKARRQQKEAQDRAKRQKDPQIEKLKLQKLMRLFEKAAKIPVGPKKEDALKEFAANKEDYSNMLIMDKTKKQQENYMKRVHGVLDKVKKMRADAGVERAIESINQVKSVGQKNRMRNSPNSKLSSKLKSDGIKKIVPKSQESFDECLESQYSFTGSVHSARSIKKRQLSTQFQRDLSLMQEDLTQAQQNFDSYGLNYFVDGTKKPKKQTKYMRDLQAQEKLMQQFNKREQRINDDDEFLPGLSAFQATMSKELADVPQAVKIFEKECINNREKVPSIFLPMADGNLRVNEKTLTLGQQKALKVASTHFDQFVDKLELNDNNLDDKDLGSLLHKILDLPKLSVLKVKRNKIGPITVLAIQKLLAKYFPNHLEQLELSENKIQPQVANKLMDVILQNSSMLSVLSLAKSNIGDVAFSKLSSVVTQCPILQINLSSCQASPSIFAEVIYALRSNRTIRHLDISNNNLFQTDTVTVKQIIKDAKNTPKRPQVITAPDKASESDVCTDLCVFIQRNKNLQHLLCVNIGLQSEQLIKVLKQIARSKTLQAAHLCNNPGLLRAEVVCEAKEIFNPFNLEDWETFSLSEPNDPNKDESQLNDINQSKKFKSAPGSRLPSSAQLPQQPDQVSEGQFQIEKAADSKDPAPKKSDAAKQPRFQNDQEWAYQGGVNHKGNGLLFLGEKRFILTRFIGHRHLVPNGERWRLQLLPSKACCWVCDGWKYTVLFWTSQHKANGQLLPQQAENAERMVQKLKQFEEAMIEDLSYKMRLPIVVGSFNDWECPQQMMEIRQFASRLDKQKPEYFQRLREDRKIVWQATSFQQLSKQERHTYKNKLSSYVEEYFPDKWKNTFAKFSPYRDPNLLNLFDVATMLMPEVYVTAFFAKPGKHQYVIADFRDRQNTITYTNTFESEPRTEQIPLYHRLVKPKVKNFDFSKSIFAQWPVATQSTYEKCVEHDLRFWKASRLIKDYDDLVAVHRMMVSYAKELILVFINLSGKSQFPAIGWMDITLFTEECKMVDQNRLKTANVDRQIIASNVENTDEDTEIVKQKDATKTELLRIRPEGALVRFQFLELLLRLAGQKYFEEPGTATYAESLQKLIEDNILYRYQYEAPIKFRTDLLFTMSCARTFKVNESMIQALYKKFCKRKKFIMMDDLQTMLQAIAHLDKPGPFLGVREFTYLYALSKGIVIEESRFGIGYLRVKLHEMIEIIARAAHQKYDNTNQEHLGLHKHIEMVLNELFQAHFGLASKSADQMSDSDDSSAESESDY